MLLKSFSSRLIIVIVFLSLISLFIDIAHPQADLASINFESSVETERFARQVIDASSAAQSIQLSFETTSFGRDLKGVIRIVQVGTIAFQRPYKFAVFYTQGATKGGESEVIFKHKFYFVTDGVMAWVPDMSSVSGEKGLVGKFDLIPWQVAQEIRLKAIQAPKQDQQSVLLGQPTQIPPHQLNQRVDQLSNYWKVATKEYVGPHDGLFFDAAEPLFGVPLRRVRYEKDEPVDGVPCHVFWTEFQADGQEARGLLDIGETLKEQYVQRRPQRHWIGITDGTPRRIDYFCGTEVCTTTQISKVLVDQPINPELFDAPKSASPPIPVENFREELENRIKTLQENQKNKFFIDTFGIENKDTKNTQNAGGGFLGGTAATRFETGKFVTVPKEPSFNELPMSTPEASKVLETLTNFFPADSQLLKEKSNLRIFLKTSGTDGDMDWEYVVWNKIKRTYFFMHRWAH